MAAALWCGSTVTPELTAPGSAATSEKAQDVLDQKKEPAVGRSKRFLRAGWRYSTQVTEFPLHPACAVGPYEALRLAAKPTKRGVHDQADGAHGSTGHRARGAGSIQCGQ